MTYRSLLQGALFALATAMLVVPAGTASAQGKKDKIKAKVHKAKAKAHEAKAEDHREKAKEERAKAREEQDKAKQAKAKGKNKEAARHAAKAKEHAARAQEHAAKAAGQAGKAAGAAANAAAAMGNGNAATRLEHIKKQAQQRKAQRASRANVLRKQARARAKVALRGKPMDKALKQELRRHARRMARLHRIQTVAAEAENTDAVTRIDKLMAKEQRRHNQWMVVYTKGGNPDKAKDPNQNGPGNAAHGEAVEEGAVP